MTVRLTVVIVQGPKRDQRTSDHEEDVLTRVMLESNLDAVFVGPLEQMQLDSTDALCLSKIPSSSVILSWLPATMVDQHCERIGLHWRLTGQPQTSPLRYLQLDLSNTPESLVAELQQLLKRASLQTVQISLSPIPKIANPAEMSAAKSAANPAEKSAAKSATAASANADVVIQPNRNQSNPSVSQPDALDRLVQDLEAMDL